MPWWTRAQVSEIQLGCVRCRHNALASLSSRRVSAPHICPPGFHRSRSGPHPLLAYSAAVQDMDMDIGVVTRARASQPSASASASASNLALFPKSASKPGQAALVSRRKRNPAGVGWGGASGADLDRDLDFGLGTPLAFLPFLLLLSGRAPGTWRRAPSNSAGSLGPPLRATPTATVRVRVDRPRPLLPVEPTRGLDAGKPCGSRFPFRCPKRNRRVEGESRSAAASA